MIQIPLLILFNAFYVGKSFFFFSDDIFFFTLMTFFFLHAGCRLCVGVQ